MHVWNVYETIQVHCFQIHGSQSLGGMPFRMKCTHHTNLCDIYNDNVGVLITMATCKEYSYMSAKVISYVIINMHLVARLQ